MEQRGVTLEDIQRALDEGWLATDARVGALGKAIVLPYAREWEGSFYLQKEVTVYYKQAERGIILLTVKARYGSGFLRGESQ